MSTVVAVVLPLAVVAYARGLEVLTSGPAWDLTAGGVERGGIRVRYQAFDWPAWEANHVLISSFRGLVDVAPEAYAPITLTLFVPLALQPSALCHAARALRRKRSSS
jgi:hypothetical protein